MEFIINIMLGDFLSTWAYFHRFQWNMGINMGNNCWGIDMGNNFLGINMGNIFWGINMGFFWGK